MTGKPGRPKGRTEPTRPGSPKQKLTADTPLTPIEQKFIYNYIENGGYINQALRDTGIDVGTAQQCGDRAKQMFARPNVQAEIKRIMEEARKNTIAMASEVMEYFTKVMRGEEKDQFGLDASLSERTRAAQELAKRTVDIENRQNGVPDQQIAIKLDWTRSKPKE